VIICHFQALFCLGRKDHLLVDVWHLFFVKTATYLAENLEMSRETSIMIQDEKGGSEEGHDYGLAGNHELV